MAEVVVVIGPGQIGQAIARRVGVGKHVVLADIRQENANVAAEVLGNAGYDVTVAPVDVSSRASVHALVESAMRLGDVTRLIRLSASRSSCRDRNQRAPWSAPIKATCAEFRARNRLADANTLPSPL